jgi:4-hydroxy-2-oxoheptanedioate aldolase
VDGGHADNGFFAEDLRRCFETANQERFVVLQIESAPTLAELDQIVALKGFDILFFGVADFSQSIGAPGDWEHPKIAAATRRIAAACRSHGKIAGICASEENVGKLIDIGYRFIDIGTDTDAVRGYCASLLESVKNADRRKRSQLEQ